MKAEPVLAVDVGNSRLKWGLGQARHLTKGTPFCSQPETLESELTCHWRDLSAPAAAVVSNVKGQETADVLRAWLLRQWDLPACFVTVSAAAHGVANGYEDPSALGVDRWIAMIAARGSHTGPLCVADCGTALTLDAVDGEGRHLGGVIAPGLRLMRQSLASGAAALQGLQAGLPGLPARNTADAVQSGTLQMSAGLIERFAMKMEAALGSMPRLFLTGGDAPVIAGELNIPYVMEPDLILQGLLLIAEGDS